MGIHNLNKVLKKYYTPVARKSAYFKTKKIAFDASLLMYQYLIAIRSEGVQLSAGDSSTSHINGFFYKVINLVESGIKPVFIFDGKALEIKSQEILKRNERRAEAEKKYSEAEQIGDKEQMAKFDKRKMKITQEHCDEIKRLLTHMGVPFLNSENEAEALCVQLCKEKVVDFVCTEDMDALCFGAPYLLRNPKKNEFQEYNLKEILEKIDMTFEQFVDFCILLGCDYAGTLPGIGVVRAENLIRKHQNIENILTELEITDYDFKHAREAFFTLKSKYDLKTVSINWTAYNRENVVQFLQEKGFDEKRVSTALDRYEKCKSANKGNQIRLTDMFKKK
ncbi:5'-3' exonuclease [Pseudoloma neurophilia]|uniref:5'-3' exonuclease n=1 Tax=Pseudoloma neurophilia TaxID=146866 RepID=A0A0R0M426_9MICR|nr:5'-3' exonuclease [Pseudoloma neurophilia]